MRQNTEFTVLSNCLPTPPNSLSKPLSIFDLQLIHLELGTHCTYLNGHDPTPLFPLSAGDATQGPVHPKQVLFRSRFYLLEVEALGTLTSVRQTTSNCATSSKPPPLSRPPTFPS